MGRRNARRTACVGFGSSFPPFSPFGLGRIKRDPSNRHITLIVQYIVKELDEDSTTPVPSPPEARSNRKQTIASYGPGSLRQVLPTL